MGGCLRCGGRGFRRVTETLSAEFPASGFTARRCVPGRQCTRCREIHVADSVAWRFALAVACELADLGIRTGEAVRHMRKALELRAVDLARLLDVTPETISHWETGKARINRTAFVALASMVQDLVDGRTTTRDRLVALTEERRPPRIASPRLRRREPT